MHDTAARQLRIQRLVTLAKQNQELEGIRREIIDLLHKNEAEFAAEQAKFTDLQQRILLHLSAAENLMREVRDESALVMQQLSKSPAELAS